MLRLNFHVISIFCLLRLHRALYKIHMWKLFDYGKIKNWKKVLGKERKKKQVQRRKKEYHSVKKRKKFLCKKCVVHIHRSFSGFSIFAVGFAFACGNFAHYCVVLLNAPPSDRKRKRGVWNQEPITYVLVMGSCCNGLLFPGNLDPSSLTPGGPVVSLVWGEMICWLGASRLRTFMS